MPNQKGFSKIAIIIIVLILIGGAYFVFSKKDGSMQIQDAKNQNSQSDNSPTDQLSVDNWKTYRNDQYGFDVKYPENFVVSRQTDSSLYLASDQSCFDKIKKASPGYVEKGCSYYLMLIQDNKIIEEGVGVVREVVKISGLSGEKIINQSSKTGDEYASITIQFEKRNKWYIFNVINNISDNHIAKDTMDKILSTFKLTK